MYVDASDCCNDLTFQLGETGLGTAIANRQWSIKVKNTFISQSYFSLNFFKSR